MIDPKFCTSKLKHLSRPEQENEINNTRKPFLLQLYQQDLETAQLLNININRTIRLLFHQWLKTHAKEDNNHNNTRKD
jgi:hypothetical protein